MKLTSRERILRIFRNEPVDRPALKLWGATPDEWLLHPDYRPVHKLAMKTTDLFDNAYSPFDILRGCNPACGMTETVVDTAKPTLKDRHEVLHTPKGDLHAVHRYSLAGEPGYTLEHFVKDAEDLERILSIPWEPHPFSLSTWTQKNARIGDRGIVMLSLDHAAYALHRLTGSETLAFLSVEERSLVEEAISVFSSRIRCHAREAIQAGFRGVFAWVGPELIIPPLLSPRDFDDFVLRYDKPLCDEIHEAGGYVWVHCHGKVSSFLERFIRMGVDVLNPLEPPKNGDILLSEEVARHGSRIGWEGNIEIQDILLDEPGELMEKIKTCVAQGSASGRFILCPSAGYMEYPNPTEKYIRNLKLYLAHGLDCCCRA